MNVISFLNLGALVFYAAAMGVIAAAIIQKRIHRSAGILAVICMGISFFVCLSNILEHLSMSVILDEYEGFAHDLFALFLLLFLYLDSIHRELDRRVRNERQIEAALEEKTILLKEIHHRVKNNLQIVSSLLSLQEDAHGDRALSDNIMIARNRILAIAAVHEIIYASSSISRLEAAGFFESIISNLTRAFSPGNRSIEIIRSFDDSICLDVDSAIPVGLIVNELISNSLKHAFTGRDSGTIEVALRRIDGDIELRVADNGSGMEGGDTAGGASGIGMELVRSLAKQIHGTMTVDASGGTSVSIIFSDQHDRRPRQ